MVEAGIQRKLPPWFWAVAVLGIAWNIFGLVQFMGAVTATSASLAAKGMTPEQIDVYLSIPFWMNFAFGVGVIGGLIGSILMAVKNKGAQPVLLASLVAYVVLYIGDIVHGVFAALGPPQVIVLTVVVAIAAALLWVARFSDKQRLAA
ncbi:MAG: hypothetical protein O9270_05920 [Aquidulcibacter sp.]|uniref:hypothetical protein n=1 Tax=Aquidulcibacter sp. TaxID=2052990 RepID=UPI0022C051DF|nr:hypothetical protein [Aquidulcibacter sp.]MCE2889955.1 hypothetical protein [Hyphomonadaceae bacterium]MCZ8207716.1 hypothetical protein [Aquidulcibacter sp.]